MLVTGGRLITMILRLSVTALIMLICFSALAQDQSQQEALQQAADFYLNKIRSDSNNLALHRELMNMYSGQGLIRIPLSIYRDSAERYPKNPVILYVLGYAYLLAVDDPLDFEDSLNSRQMAEKNLKAALKERPMFPDALAALGDYYLEVGQPELALEKWKEAVEENSKFEPAHLSLARFYRSQKEYDKAIEEYQRSISISPKSHIQRSATSLYIAERYLELGLTYFDKGDLDRAEKAFLKAKDYSKSLAMAYYKLGQVYARRGERDKAVKIYRTGRKYDPDNAEVAYELAHIFLETNDTKYALLSMERGLTAEAVDPEMSRELIARIEKGTIAAADFMSQLADFEYSNNFHLHYFLGKLYVGLDIKELAIKHLRKALGLDRSNADVNYQLGLLQEKAEPEAAREYYQKAAEMATPGGSWESEADLLFKAAQSYLEEGQEGKFIETAKRALAIDPNRADVHLQLAEIFKKRADIYKNNGQENQEDEALKEAVGHYEQYVTLQPSAESWYELGLLYERQGKIKSVRAYDKSIQLDPSFAQAYYRRGNFMLNQKFGRAGVLAYDTKDAAADLKKAIQLDDQLADAHFSLGKAYHQMNMPEQATAEFLKTVEIDPDYVKAHIYLAQDYAAAGEYQKVIKHLSKAAELDDSNAEVLKTLGAMLLKYGGDAGEQPAREALEKAYKLKPDDAEILANYAYTLYLDRMFNQAIDNYEKAVEIRPDYPEAHYNLALAYSAVRKYELAQQHWERVLQLAPDSQLASKAAEYIKKLEESKSP